MRPQIIHPSAAKKHTSCQRIAAIPSTSEAMAFAKPNIYHEHYLAALAHYAHRKMKLFEAREVSNALWSFTIFSKNIVDQNWWLGC